VLDHLSRVLADERRESITAMVIDLDRFKLVNDSMGHSFGDGLILAVAARLTHGVRPGDVVARVGGDEFLVVLHGVPDEATAHDSAERTRLSFKYPLGVDDVEMTVSASVGVTFVPVGTFRGPESILRDADTAMSRAKDAGRDSVAMFDTSMRERVAERLTLERELRHALERGELEVHYQPKLRLSDLKVTGMEALLRWNHPTRGQVRPDLFIPIAEDTGMIDEIGMWVLDQACGELVRQRSELRQPDLMSVSVNLSVRQMRADSLVDNVARTLLQHGLPGNALCLELTESMFMENLEGLRRQLDALRACGVKISIDDFGTGYSSLAYLRSLAVDEVKIDRAFVRDLDSEGNSGTSVVAAVVAIASSMGITTVAEGVETDEQVETLRNLGCTEVQGFLFSRPVAASEVTGVMQGLGLAGGARLRVVPNSA
jgi:diguanylate cyclase (GGDEF)-like protein